MGGGAMNKKNPNQKTPPKNRIVIGRKMWYFFINQIGANTGKIKHKSPIIHDFYCRCMCFFHDLYMIFFKLNFQKSSDKVT